MDCESNSSPLATSETEKKKKDWQGITVCFPHQQQFTVLEIAQSLGKVQEFFFDKPV